MYKTLSFADILFTRFLQKKIDKLQGIMVIYVRVSYLAI